MHIRLSANIRKLKFKNVKLWDRAVGDVLFLKEKYIRIYGAGDFSADISRIKKENRRRYLLTAIFFVIVLLSIGIWEFIDAAEGICGSPEKVTAVIRPDDSTSLRLNLRVRADGTVVRETAVTLKQPASTTDTGQDAASKESLKAEPWNKELDQIIRDIGKNTSAHEINLPSQLSDGTKITWELVEKSNLPIAALMFIPIFAGIYNGRYHEIKRTEEEARLSIINELPEFTNKLVLLLNAGLVLSAAFTQIIDNYQRGNRNKTSYFYSRLSEIAINMKETNSPFQSELKSFAKRTGVRELMRFSNILCDNIDKGAELVDKLQREAELLWHSRKKMAEEQGRLAETKLTLPLMILLLVLIMVTIAPAMMEIQ